MGFLDRFRKASRVEHRNYTDVFVAASLAAASGGSVTAGLAAGVSCTRACIELWARGLSAARVSPAPAARVVTPEVLAAIGRRLGERGQFVADFYLDDSNRPGIREAHSWLVQSQGLDRESWLWRLDLGAPNGSRSVVRQSARVVNICYDRSRVNPSCGLGPLQLAAQSSVFVATLERAMAQEADGDIGRIVPLPVGASGDEDLKTALGAAKGKTLLPETTADGYQQGGHASPRKDWEPQRIGPEYSGAEVDAHKQGNMMMCGLYGVHPTLLAIPSQGQAQREAYRYLRFSTLEPLARIVEAELSRVLEVAIRLDLEPLQSHDMVQRARAVHVLTQAGMAIADARVAVGL